MKTTKHRNFLAALGARQKRKRDQVITKASKQQLNAVRNICHGVCRGRYLLPTTVHRKLTRHRQAIRDLASKTKLTSIKGVRQRLIQKGGFLPILIPAILSLLASVGGDALKKALPL